jgi:predicted AAA+ superfamily ATPase
MERKIYNKLEEWRKSRKRLPLIVQGARQVGKTYSVLSFGRERS